MKRTEIVSAHVIAGEFEGKKYRSGRLVIASYPDGAKLPSFISIGKCPAELAEQLILECPIAKATIYYDAYKNVVNAFPTEGGEENE